MDAAGGWDGSAADGPISSAVGARRSAEAGGRSLAGSVSNRSAAGGTILIWPGPGRADAVRPRRGGRWPEPAEQGRENDYPSRVPAHRIVVGVDGSSASGRRRAGPPVRPSSPGRSLQVLMTWEWPASYGWSLPIPSDYDPEPRQRNALDQALDPVRTAHPASGLRGDRHRGPPGSCPGGGVERGRAAGGRAAGGTANSAACCWVGERALRLQRPLPGAGLPRPGTADRPDAVRTGDRRTMQAAVDRPGPIDSGPLRPSIGPSPIPGPGRSASTYGSVASAGPTCTSPRATWHPERPLVVPGHEVVGAGRRASGRTAPVSSVGDRVGVPWLAHTCGVCRFCLHRSREPVPGPRFTGWDLDGGYADYVVVDERVRLPGARRLRRRGGCPAAVRRDHRLPGPAAVTAAARGAGSGSTGSAAPPTSPPRSPWPKEPGSTS